MKMFRLVPIVVGVLLWHGETLSMKSSDDETLTGQHTSLQVGLLRSVGVEEPTGSGSVSVSDSSYCKIDDKLCPYQQRETTIRLLKEHYKITTKLSILSFFRTVLVGSEVLVKLAPVATSGLSLYFGLNNQPIPGFISMLSTAVIIPFKKFVDDSIKWTENKHRDALLQEIDFLAIREFGTSATREGFMKLLLDKNKANSLHEGYSSLE
ncbi:MAG: hypothetical protein LBT63_01185 [Holosporaceae bacterium]|jgi:hypothetical protein|nr:hypothetical protein [Holosporaceae bacterium]